MTLVDHFDIFEPRLSGPWRGEYQMDTLKIFKILVLNTRCTFGTDCCFSFSPPVSFCLLFETANVHKEELANEKIRRATLFPHLENFPRGIIFIDGVIHYEENIKDAVQRFSCSWNDDRKVEVRVITNTDHPESIQDKNDRGFLPEGFSRIVS